MANENDVISRLILDDTDFVKKMESINPVIDKVAANFDSLQKDVKDASTTMGKDLVQANEKAAKSIENVTKATINDSKALEKQKQNIADVSLLIAKNSTQSDKLLAVYKKLTDARDKGILLDPQDIKELADGFDKFAKEVGLSQDQLDLLQLNLDEVVGTIKTITSDEFRELASESEQVTEKFTSAKSELRQLTNLINSGQLTGDELVQARQRAAQLTDTIGDTREQLKNLASDTRGIDTLIEGTRLVAAGFAIAEGATALFGEENEDVQRALVKLNAVMALSNGLQEVHALLLQNSNLKMRAAIIMQGLYSTVVGGSTGALKLFRIALAATGVGLLVIGLGALITNFDKAKESVTKLFPSLKNLGETFKGLKDTFYGVLDGIVAGFGVIGDVIGKIFDGDFSGAYDSAKTLGKVMGDAIIEGTKEATQDRLNKELAKQIDETVKQQKKRVEILAAGGKETANIQKNILQNELKSLELAGAEKQEIEDKQHELNVFNAERQKQLSDEAQKNREKREKEIKEATSKVRALQNELFEVLSDKKVLGEGEQFEIIKQKQIDAIILAKEELAKFGKVAGVDVTQSVKDFDLILNGIKSRDFTSTLEPITNLPKAINKNVRDLQKQLKDLETIQLNTGINTEDQQEKLKKEIDKLSGAVSNDLKPIELPPLDSSGFEASYTSELDKFIEGLTDFEGLLQDTLDDIFGDEGGEKAREFISGLSTLVGEFGSLLNEATDLQIEAIDKQLDNLSERREKAQEELDNQLEDQKKGLANNVGDKEQEVNGLIAEEERLTAERERIAQEAQRRQIIADSIQQGQSLITSSINIIKGFSNIPIIGLPLGIAAVGTLLGFFIKNKAAALKATRLYTGANRIDDHFGEVGSRSDIPGRGEGYRVVDAVTGQDTNVRISGREMLLPEDITQSQSRFFKNLKQGKYNFNIADALDLHTSLGRSVGKKSVHNTIINNTTLQPTKQWVSYTNKKGENKAILLDVPTNGDRQTYIFKD